VNGCGKIESEKVSRLDSEGNVMLDGNNTPILEDRKDNDGNVVYKINEWPAVGEWMWENRETFNGISVLPFDGGSYVQPPYTDCTKEKYEEMMTSLSKIDLTQVIEMTDNTNLTAEAACAGNNCEVVVV
jgi:ribonucleoside-diphosphate reductase alpha chain